MERKGVSGLCKLGIKGRRGSIAMEGKVYPPERPVREGVRMQVVMDTSPGCKERKEGEVRRRMGGVYPSGKGDGNASEGKMKGKGKKLKKDLKV